MHQLRNEKHLWYDEKMEFEVFIKNHVGIALTRGSLFRFGIIWQERNVVLIVSQKQHLGWHEAAKVTFQRSLCCKWFSNDTNSNRLNCKLCTSRGIYGSLKISKHKFFGMPKKYHYAKLILNSMSKSIYETRKFVFKHF